MDEDVLHGKLVKPVPHGRVQKAIADAEVRQALLLLKCVLTFQLRISSNSSQWQIPYKTAIASVFTRLKGKISVAPR